MKLPTLLRNPLRQLVDLIGQRRQFLIVAFQSRGVVLKHADNAADVVDELDVTVRRGSKLFRQAGRRVRDQAGRLDALEQGAKLLRDLAEVRSHSGSHSSLSRNSEGKALLSPRRTAAPVDEGNR